ncbi:MAG: hypothetical protein ACI86M_002843 [Saprospiraceae bacterium]|jgi:hypothetical protein
MNVVHRHIWLLFIFCLFIAASSAQDNILSRKVMLTYNENTLLGHVDNLLIQENISLSFNSSRVDLEELIILPKGATTLEVLVRAIFYKDNLKLTPGLNKVLITFIEEKVDPIVTIRGFIRDIESGEAIVGATILEIHTYSSTFSSQSGFYSLSIPRDSSAVQFSYLGYKTIVLDDFDDNEIEILLGFDNELDQVVITESISDNFMEGSGGEKIDLALTEGFQSTAGGNDLLKAVKVTAGVHSGNEGQSGLFVRGGSNDQNLILFEGVPMYEVSHAAGFSSMFIEESIRNVDFIKNGYPARYGGRLSSVLNVQLKDGNKSGIHGAVTASLPSIKVHLEGPILNNKTTFNLSGRISYLDTYLDDVLDDLINYDIDLAYNDVVAKMTHNFSPSRKLSFSYYNGGDNLGLSREVTDVNLNDDTFKTTSDVNLKWGSQVWNFNLSNVVNDKLQLSMNIGGVNYKYSSRGTYTFLSTINSLPSEAELEVVSFSGIEDYLANMNFDFYLSDKHVLKFGAGWIYHNYNPAVSSSQIINEGAVSTIENAGEIIKADELSAYIEDTYNPHENWQFYGGLHFARFNVGSTQYSNTQPRLSAIFKPGKRDRLTLSYTKMKQYVHLLVNPGIGLPSNLWVPSTDEIKPESADQVSLSYSRKLSESTNITFSGYYKKMDNLLEYRSSVDLIFLGGTNLAKLPLQEDPDWQKRVEIGESTSKGLEIQVQKNIGKWTGWAAYTLAKTTRTFESIDDGQPFPYKFDRRNDINLGIKYIINDFCSISGNWAYGSGNSFSLSIEQFRSPFGILRTSGLRNNYQQEPFHHLDVQFNYSKSYGKYGKFTLQIGMYNVYNRKNPYFIYIYDNTILGKAEARKTSLFPILPNVNVGYSF